MKIIYNKLFKVIWHYDIEIYHYRKNHFLHFLVISAAEGRRAGAKAAELMAAT